jgi:hypothetical protein
MQLEYIPQAILLTTALASLVMLLIGFNQIQAGRQSPYFRLRQQRIANGWGIIGVAVILGFVAFLTTRFSSPLGKFFPTATSAPTQMLTAAPSATSTSTPNVFANPTTGFEPSPSASLPVTPRASGTLSTPTKNPLATRTPFIADTVTRTPRFTSTLQPSLTPSLTNTHAPTKTATLIPTHAPTWTPVIPHPTITATKLPTLTSVVTPTP